MFKRLRKPITTKHQLNFVYLLNSMKRFLAVLGILGMIWSYVPWQYIQAETMDEDVIEETTGVDESVLPDYPTTTDPDFDPSQVEIESEIMDERTETTKTFRKIDGTYEVAMYNDIIHFYQDGQWIQVNNSLNDLGNELENKANKFKLKFPKYLDDNKQIKLTMGDYSIDWNILNINSTPIEYVNEDITPSNIKELVNINQSVMYQNIQPYVDIEYIITGSKVKENIILNQYIPEFSMTFEYKLKDLALIKDDDGNILFVNEDGETVFTFADLYMLDKDLNESFEVEFNIVQTGSKTYEITITPNDEWLQDAVYPVQIDPSITLKSNNTNMRDKYVYSTSGQNSTTNYIKSGYSGSYKYRSYIEIAIDSLPSNIMVDYAHLQLNVYSNYCDMDPCQVNARMVNQTTSFDSIAGQNLTDVDSRIVDYQIIETTAGSNDNFIFDITRAVKLWQQDDVNDGVIELRNKDESISDYIFFDSLEYSTTTGPRVTIGYTHTTGIKDYWTYNKQNVGNVGTGYVSDYTGKLSFVKSDINFSTEKQSLGLSLVYNVDNKDTNIGYGLGWQTNYNIKVTYDSSLGTYYSIDATGNKVYYYSTTCDSRISNSYPLSNTCYIAEDGSSNVYVREYAYGSLSQTYILTSSQIKYKFGTDEYLDSIYDIKKTLSTTITRDATYKDKITKIQDDSGNKIDLVYSSGRLYYATLSLKQNDSSYNSIERVYYYYTYRSALGDYALYYTRFYKNYDDSMGLVQDELAFYLTDSSARLTSAYISGQQKVSYAYNTGNQVTNIKSYSNNYQFGEVDYTYDYQKTTITNHNGDYINYYFDNYGHTVNVRDNYGNTKFYSYLNLFKTQFIDSYDGIIDIVLTDGNPNYKNNHKLVNSSDTMKTQFNPVNNHGFEYDNIYEEVQWNFEVDGYSGSTYYENGFVEDHSVYGDHSAKIRVTNGTLAHYEQTIVLDEGMYTLSGYVMNDTDSDTEVYITVNGEYWQSSITEVPNDGEWHYITLGFEVYPDNQDIDIQLYNHGEGYAYFDSIQIVSGFRDTRKNIIDNPSMEIVDTSGDLPGWYFSNSNYVSRVEHSSFTSGIDAEILGDYSIEIEGSSTETRYAMAGLHSFLELPYQDGTLIVGSWAYSEGTPTSQMGSTISTINDIDRKFRIYIEVQDYNWDVIATHYIDFDPSIEGWQYILEEVSVPEDGRYVYVYFEYQGEGTVNFDGLQVYYEKMNTNYRFDTYGHVVEITTPSGDSTEFEYDNSYDDRATRIAKKTGDIELEITDDDELVSEIDFNNVKSTPTYNSDGLVTQLIVGDTSSDYFTTSTSYLSTGFGQYKSTTTDEFNKTTTYYHDTLTGLLEAIQNAKGEDLYYVYDNEGKLVKAVSLSDHNNPTSNIHGMVEYEYDSKDRLSKIIIDNNYYYELVYDTQNRISQVKVNSQTLMSYSYEMDDTIYTNRLSTQTYGNGDEMKFIYNDENQITEVQFKNSGGSFESRFGYEYDQSGNLAVFKTYIDGVLDKSEYYTYDSSNRLIQVTDNEGNEIKYMYDEQGNVTSLYFSIDEVEGSTNYFYNHCFTYSGDDCISKSNLYDYTEYTTQSDVDVTKEYNHESSALYRLDYINLVTGTTDLVKQDFVYVGDTTRLYEITYDILNNGSVEYKYRYTYDSLGNIENIYYYEGTTLKTHEHYEYDELNQLVVEDVWDDEVSCTTVQDTCYSKYFYYDDHGNITDIKTFAFGVDENNSIDFGTTQNWYLGGTIHGCGYDSNTAKLTITYPEKILTTDTHVQLKVEGNYNLYSYNGTTFYKVKISGYEYAISIYEFGDVSYINIPVSTLSWNSSDNGYLLDYQMLWWAGCNNGSSYYAPSDPIITTVPTFSSIPVEHIHYSYDSTWLDQMTGYGTIDYVNGVPQTEVAVQDYTYDNQGNPTTITNFYYSGDYYDHADLAYDGRQLTEIIVYDVGYDEVVTISYTYNDQGYRTSKTIDNGVPVTINYTLSGDKVIYETDGTYGIVYTYDYDGKIISFNYDVNVNDSSDGIEYFYLRNQQGDITKILDKDGNVEVEYKYDAWGNILDIEDHSGQEEVSYINRYLYRGYRYDSEIKLYYLNSRFYNPVVGRFINADGIVGSVGNPVISSVYSYTSNNPIMRVDSSGYEWEIVKMFKDYYSKRSSEIAKDGVTAGEIIGLAVENLFFPSWQDPLISYVSKKTGVTLVRGYSVSAGFLLGASYSYQRVYTPDGKIVDQSVTGLGGGIMFGASGAAYLGIMFEIDDSSQMTGYGETISGDYGFLHGEIDRYSYDNDIGHDLGMNFGASLGAGVFMGKTKTKELRVIYD